MPAFAAEHKEEVVLPSTPHDAYEEMDLDTSINNLNNMSYHQSCVDNTPTSTTTNNDNAEQTAPLSPSTTNTSSTQEEYSSPVSPSSPSSTVSSPSSLSSPPLASPTSPTSPPSPTPNPTPSTVIIFDWDDTLLASSHLAAGGIRLDSDLEIDEQMDAQLKLLEASVAAILSEAIQLGEVHIITNAEIGWVELSARKFMPNVVPLLQHVNILSARSTFESSFPDSPLKWKYCAFHARLAPTLANLHKSKNIISFGDSHVEREAVRAVTRGIPNVRTKSIKFAERPSLEQLQRQLELVKNCFQYIFSHDGDLDLMLTISLLYKNQKASSPSSPQQQPVAAPLPPTDSTLLNEEQAC